MENRIVCPSSLGPLTIVERGGALTEICFGDGGDCGDPVPLILRAAEELREYFEGGRREFDLPLAPAGTAFQQAVWQALREIPYGSTWTYAQIARVVGNPAACRAVGMANHRNPLPIVIPCHRVVGSDGSLTGYAGGLEVKRRLLYLESRFSAAKAETLF